MIVLRPVDGHPGVVRDLAAALAALGQRVAATERLLLALTRSTDWSGPAAEAFGGRARAVAPVLDAAARRYAGAAAALVRFADALETAQAVVGHAVTDHEEAGAALLRVADALGRAQGAGLDDPVVQRLRAEQQAQVVRLRAAEADHRRAWAAYDEEDRACAAVLRRLAHDGLADSTVYRALTGIGDAGSATGAALALFSVDAPPLAALGGAAGVVGAAADATVLLSYGDGSWGEVATDATLGVLGAGGRVLRVGADAQPSLHAASMSTRARLAEGLIVATREQSTELRSALRALGPQPPLATTGLARAAGGHGLRDLAVRARTMARAKAEEAFLEDWRTALTLGAAHPAPGMAYAAAEVRLAHRAGTTARAVSDADEHLDRVRHPRRVRRVGDPGSSSTP